MKIFKDYQPRQVLLMPPSSGEFVPENHEVRVSK